MTDWEQLLESLFLENSDAAGETESHSFIALAIYHGVMPRMNVPSLAPFRQKSQGKALLNLKHLQLLAVLFMEKKIPWLGIKGLPLALRLYKDVGKRHAGDIDLWVPEKRVEEIHQLLVNSGHSAKTGYAELSPYYQEKYRLKKFHVGYTHVASGVSVEIHWRLGSTKELYPITFEEAHARRQVLEAGPVEIPTLDDHDHLLFLYIHAARHLWERLFWLVDIVDYHKLPGAPTPAVLLERASQLGIERAVKSTLILASEILEFDPGLELCNDPVSKKLAEWGREHLLRSKPGMNPGRAVRSSMMLHNSLTHTFQVMTEIATAADDWYRVKLPDGLGGLYLLIRPFFWIRRKLDRGNK